MHSRRRLLLVSLLLGCAARQAGPAAPIDPQARFWAELQALCGKAYAGTLTEGTSPSDDVLRTGPLIMHVRTCTPGEVRIPFHAGEDRSRTWVLSRTADGLRLKHEHRHEDGSEDALTQYGGDTRAPGTAERQEFHADAYTAGILPAAATNVWTVELVPGARLAYSLRREGRRVRVDFDLTHPVPAPPPPWGTGP